MFCIYCGTQNNETIRFCTRCGTNLEVFRQAVATPPADQSQLLVGPQHVRMILYLTALVTVIGFACIAGIVIPIAVLPTRINSGDIGGIVAFITLFGFATMFLIITRLLRMLTTAGTGKVSKKEKRAMQQSAVPMAALPAQPQNFGVGSVLEHTTAHLPQYVPAPSASPPASTSGSKDTSPK